MSAKRIGGRKLKKEYQGVPYTVETTHYEGEDQDYWTASAECGGYATTGRRCTVGLDTYPVDIGRFTNEGWAIDNMAIRMEKHIRVKPHLPPRQ